MSLPFKGLKFCSTSVPSDIRLEMVSKIKAMGGEHFSHLMSDVDVLIVGDRDTDKYKYSVKNRADIEFVRPKAIYTIYDNWMRGDEVPPISIRLFAMPVFDGLNICISRVSNSKEKLQIVEAINGNNGSLTDSLTINNTSVIASERTGKRYEKAIEWGIPVVHPQWIFDSIKRGAALEYKYYEISKVSHNIGEGSCACWDALQSAAKNLKRPLVDDSERTVKAAKRENKIWQNIIGNAKPPSFEASKNTMWDADDQEEEQQVDSFKLRSRTIQKETKKPEEQSQLFLGFFFGVHGFDDPAQLSKVIRVIRSHSGEVSDDLTSDIKTITHLIIPSVKPLQEVPTDITSGIEKHGFKLVTEWFIERCLHYNTIKDDIWGKPLPHHNLQLNLQVSISGFTGIELLHTIKLIQLLGCTYCETLTEKRDLMVVNLGIIGLNAENSPKLFSYKYPELISCSDSNRAGLTSTKNKINACKKWGVPIVSLAYLVEAAESRFLPELLDHKWCIFAPRGLAKPRSLMEYVKKLGNGTLDTPKQEQDTTNQESPSASPSSSAQLPKLPSPLKKKKKNWGRLIGRAQESQFTKNFLEDTEATPNLTEQTALEPSTQISYNDLDRDSETTVRRETRSHLKELNQDL